MGNKLKNPPVKEVVFEILLENPTEESTDYSIILNELFTKISKSFPTLTSLPGAKIPLGFPEPIIRHRISSQDGKSLVNVGENIISVNSLDYSTFTDFKKLVSEVLKAFEVVFPQPVIKRLGLRYVNIIDGSTNLDRTNILKFELTSPLTEKTASKDSLFVYKYVNGNKLNLRYIEGILQKETDIALDFDFYQSPNKKLTEDEIKTWIEIAHTEIEAAFLNSFKKEFLDNE